MISASILNGDLAHLSDVAQIVKESGADMLHFDVMDGLFVDNISFGLPVLSALRTCTDLPIDVHLMIENPLRFVDRFVKAGADLLSFHIESKSDTVETLKRIHEHHIPAGIAISPDTPTDTVFPILKYMNQDDFILLMTVYPGLGGQKFMPQVLPKIQLLYQRLKAENLPLHIQVDGGINAETGRLCINSGADYLVAGSYILGNETPEAAVSALKDCFAK